MSKSVRVFLYLAIACTMLTLGFVTIGQSQSPQSAQSAATEAPTGFDDLTNGMVDQATHDEDRGQFFEEVDSISQGLGPVFNDTSCVNCHKAPNAGGGSQTVETRVGHTSHGQFVNPTVPINGGADTIAGRSLINSQAICVQAQETIPATETIRAHRASVNTLGDGFIEAIPDQTLVAISLLQRVLTRNQIHGVAQQVPIVESPNLTRIGRFGWKDQHGSLLSFAGDAYLNEQGITSRLFPTDVTAVCDTAKDPEDTPGADGLADIDHFARFIRATKAPPVDATLAAQPAAQAGSAIFDSIGCQTCHVRNITTAPAGAVINGNFTVPDALGNKIIHPFSDFLLHDVGTGDGIVQNGSQSTANELRTPPLWGARIRSNHLMHDGASTSFSGAILRHGDEASGVINNYQQLTTAQKNQILAFLNSL